MLTPEYLQGLPAELEQLYLRLEEETIADISRRIAKVGHISDTAEYQILRMRELGAGTEYIKSKIREYSGLSDDVVEQLFFDAAQVSDDFYKNAYDKAGKEYKPFEYNDFFQQIVVANVNQTKGELSNLTQSMGFSYRGSNGERRFRPVATAYRECLDYAFTQVETGTTDYITAIRNATRRLTESGLQFVDYESGVVNHVDVAVRRAVLTGISQVTGKISEHNAAELETDIVEVTAHAGARPDHAEWQGGWYSLSGKSKKYRSLAEATGYGRVDGLKGANCRHDFFPVIEGIDVPLYTKEELANIDPPPFEYNGKRYTYYEATQKQRSMERAIRKTKREILAADKTGDKDRFTEKSIRLRRQREEYGKFSNAAGLLTQNERNQVVGFGRSEASRASWAARSAQTSGNGPKGTPPSGSSSSTSSHGSPFQTSISQNNAMGKTNQIVVDKPAISSGGNELFRGLTNGGGSGILNKAKAIDMFNDSEISLNSPITTKQIIVELTTTNIGRTTLQDIENLPERIKLTNEAKSGGVRGEQSGDDITIFLSNCKNVKWAARTVIHEITHHKYGIGQSQWAECVCVAQELKHARNRDYLTVSELRTIISAVKKTYPEYNWRKGGVINGRRRSR